MPAGMPSSTPMTVANTVSSMVIESRFWKNSFSTGQTPIMPRTRPTIPTIPDQTAIHAAIRAAGSVARTAHVVDDDLRALPREKERLRARKALLAEVGTCVRQEVRLELMLCGLTPVAGAAFWHADDRAAVARRLRALADELDPPEKIQ